MGEITKQPENRNPITAVIEPRTNELVQVFMGDPVKAERFKAQAATLAVASPNLAACSASSLWLALKGVAELDLDLTPSLGHAYIIPYGQKATLIIGYKGLKEIAFRSGVVKRMESVIVYLGDDFTYQRGTDPKIHHVPATFDKRGAVIGAYCVATLSNGEIVFEVMSKAEIDTIAAKSNSKNVWRDHYGEMARKTPLRRLCKYLPTTPLLSKALSYDEDTVAAVDGTEVLTPKRPSLADNIAGRDAGAEPAPDSRALPAAMTEPEPGDVRPEFRPVEAGPISAAEIPF